LHFRPEPRFFSGTRHQSRPTLFLMSTNSNKLSGLPWLRIGAESGAIVLSILLAFALEAWWDNNRNQAEEGEIIERFIVDIQADSVLFAGFAEIVVEKEESLNLVADVLGRPSAPLSDSIRFVVAVIKGSNFGWNQGLYNAGTFEDVINSGKLSRIQSSEIRVTIAQYYNQATDADARMDEREGRYPHISYRLVPRVDEFELATDVRGSRLRDVVRAVRESELGEHVLGEINFARFELRMIANQIQSAANLLSELRSYRASI